MSSRRTAAIRVEVFGDPSLPDRSAWITCTSILPEADIPAIKAWYTKVFGGFPGKRQRVARPGVIDMRLLPPLQSVLSRPRAVKLAPTKGRAIDHLGFDVKNLEEFEKKPGGTRHQVRGAAAPGSRILGRRIAFLTDPWGTYIEVTEKLAP